jgi:hypothetical protein
MTNAERYAEVLRGMRSDPAALEFYSQPNYGFERSNTSGVINLALEKMAKKITNGLTTDYEKALAIHTWVADNIYYDYPLAAYHENPDTPAPESATDPIGVLELGRTVCEGYSRLAVSLLRSIGIPARYVTGNRFPGHAWNEVFADNRWIFVDATWDSGNKWYGEGDIVSGGADRSLRYFDCELSSFASKHLVGDPSCPYASDFGEFDDFLGIITLDDKLLRIWTLPEERLEEFAIPEYVTDMGEVGANTDIRANIKKLIIPGSVTKITGGGQPGGGYRSVEHIVFDMDELPYRIGSLWGATELTLGPNVKTIADQAFTNNFYLKAVEIPETVKELNSTAFNYNNIKSVIIRNPNIKFISDKNSWAYMPSGTAFYVPVNSETEKLCNEFFVTHGNRVLPLEAQPSAWAKADIDRAKTLGLTPYNLDLASTANITRIEFCHLAAALYENLKGTVPIPDYLMVDPLGLFLTSIDEEHEDFFTFADTSDIDVYKMYALGVVKGAGKDDDRDIFNPYGELTREQAAAILSRLSAALGKPLPDAAPDFADNTGISAWATADVGKVQSSGIMSGGGGRFDPQGKYTREQSIVTMLRLMDRAS